MSDSSSALVLELVAGSGEPRELVLWRGVPLDPLAIGTQGAMRVLGEGVAPLHAYVCFDGERLFVRPHDGAMVTIGGRPVEADWTAMSAGDELALGGVRLRCRSPEEGARSSADEPDEQTRVAAPPVRSAMATSDPRPAAGAPPPRPSVPTHGPDSQRTQALAPSAPLAVPTPAYAAQPPHAPAPYGHAPHAFVMGAGAGPEPGYGPHGAPHTPQGGFAPHALHASGAFPGAPLHAPPTPPFAPHAQMATGAAATPSIAERWLALSTPRKVLVALSPLLVLAAIDLLLLDDPRSVSPRTTERVAGAGSSAASAAPIEPAPAPSPAATVAAVATSDAVDPASLPTAAPEPSAPAPSQEPTARPSGPTMERRAVDALIAGERARAAALYDGLAAQSPNNPAFARAALLLRRPSAPTSSP